MPTPPDRQDLSAVTEELQSGAFAGHDLNAFLHAKRPATFCFRVDSDAMAGEGIMPGDIILCRRDLAPRHLDLLVAVVGDRFLIRRWVERPEPLFRASNPRYPDIPVSGTPSCSIFGVVSGMVRKIQRPRGGVPETGVPR